MRTILAAFVLMTILLAGCAGHQRALADTRVRRVLIVTGADYDGHNWRETTPVLAAAIERDPRLRTEVLDDLRLLAGTDLRQYDALVLHFKNYDPAVPGRAAFDKLVRYADAGGGLVLVHFACGAFEEFRDEYERLVGRVWFGIDPPPGAFQHDPYGAFTVQISSVDHPITRGMSSFDTRDELYTCLEGRAPIGELASATSVRDGRSYPIAFVTETPGRRVFQCVLGHDAAALGNPPVAELYRRATAWAAGCPPTTD